MTHKIFVLGLLSMNLPAQAAVNTYCSDARGAFRYSNVWKASVVSDQVEHTTSLIVDGASQQLLKIAFSDEKTVGDECPTQDGGMKTVYTASVEVSYKKEGLIATQWVPVLICESSVVSFQN